MNININKNLLFNLIIGDTQQKNTNTSLKNIYKIFENISLINLKQTLKILCLASNYIKINNILKSDILILSPDYLIDNIENIELYNYISTRWLGGTLTNFKETYSRIQKIKNQKNNLSKKDLFYINCLNITTLPKLIICLDSKKYKLALLECQKLKIPTIVFCDSSSIKNEYTFPIMINTQKLYKNVTLLNLLFKYL